jgi:hypothetical protein
VGRSRGGTPWTVGRTAAVGLASLERFFGSMADGALAAGAGARGRGADPASARAPAAQSTSSSAAPRRRIAAGGGSRGATDLCLPSRRHVSNPLHTRLLKSCSKSETQPARVL